MNAKNKFGFPQYNVAIFSASGHLIEELYRKGLNARDVFKTYAGRIVEYSTETRDGERVLNVWVNAS